MDDANTDMLMLERYVGLLQRIAAEAKVLHQTGLFREVVDLYNMAVCDVRKARTIPKDFCEEMMDYWKTGQLGEELEKMLNYKKYLKLFMEKIPVEVDVMLRNSLDLLKNDPFCQTYTYVVLKKNGKI